MPRQLTPFKICSLCKELKSRKEYTKRRSGLYEARCKNCRNTVQKDKYAADIDMRFKHQAVASKWQKDNAERHRQSCSVWEKNNRPARVSAMHRYRTRKTGNGGSYSVSEWETLKHTYNHTCLCCGATNKPLTADHILPVVSGGTSDIDNIQPLCKSCNSKKQNKFIDYRISRGV